MNNYSIQLIENQSSPLKQLIFSGELSINYIHFIKDEIYELVNPEDPFDFLVKDADIIDLSFIQLLISLKRCNSQSSLTLQLNDEISALLTASGFSDLLKKNSK